MKSVTFLFILIFGTISCTGLPKLDPVNSSIIPEIHKRCSALFLNGRWEFIHSIEATMPNNKKSFIIGITVISPEIKRVESVIMTIEGLVLFDACYEQKVVINRGIPPFDSVDFARHLMDDIKLMFFKPDGQIIEAGMLSSGEYVCRHKSNDGHFVDIVTNNVCAWEIRRYTPSAALRKTIKASHCKTLPGSNGIRIPGRIELDDRGANGYSLTLELIGAKPLAKN